MSYRLSRQALRGEKQRLARERDRKLDAAIRRIQRERVEFDDASKAEAEEEARRLEEVRRWWSWGGGFFVLLCRSVCNSCSCFAASMHRVSDGKRGVGFDKRFLMEGVRLRGSAARRLGSLVAMLVCDAFAILAMSEVLASGSAERSIIFFASHLNQATNSIISQSLNQDSTCFVEGHSGPRATGLGFKVGGSGRGAAMRSLVSDSKSPHFSPWRQFFWRKVCPPERERPLSSQADTMCAYLNMCVTSSALSRCRQSHAHSKRSLAEKQGQWEERHAECTEALHHLVETRFVHRLL